MYHNMIPANKHLILQRAFSKDLPLLFVPTLAGNFLLLLGMEYLVEAQFDAVLVQDLQVADSAANVKALEMVVTWTQFFALRFVLSAITSPYIFKRGKLGPENPISIKDMSVNPQLSSLIQCYTCRYILYN